MSDSRTDQRMDEELARHVRRAFGFEEPPRTYEEFWVEMSRTYAEGLGRELSADDLCTTDRSPHWARVGGDTHYYQCVTDALLLGAYLDEPVTARTVSPGSGTEIVVEFDADGVASAPEGALLSFGVERSVEAPDGAVTPAKMYGRFCPYGKAFASRDEYEEWTAANPEVVADAQPLGEALDLLGGLLSSADPDGQLAAGEGCSC